MPKLIIISIVLSLLFISSHAQVNDSLGLGNVTKYLCLLTGINYSNYVFAELGVSVNTAYKKGIHPGSASYFVSNEIHFVNKPFIGPKVGFSISILITTFGFNVIYYTDFKQNSIAFRPEIGFGFDWFRMTYGYNKILNKSFDRVIQNTFGIMYCFKIKKLKVKE